MPVYPGALKMHTLLDLHGSIPTFIRITEGKMHDVNVLDELIPEVGSFYVMDRGYIDFERLYRFTLCSAFFVVRSKENILLQRRYSRPVDRSSGVRSDQTVILTARLLSTGDGGATWVDSSPAKKSYSAATDNTEWLRGPADSMEDDTLALPSVL